MPVKPFLSLLLGMMSLLPNPSIEGVAHAQVHERIRIVATIPVLKEFALRVGGERVEAHSLITGMESEHTYEPRPQDLAALKSARVLLQVGVGLEVWVNSLIKNAAPRDLVVITTSTGISLLRGPNNHGSPSLSGRPAANPHVWLDPENAKIMIKRITDGLISLNPSGRGSYLENQARYLREIDHLEKTMKAAAGQLKDRKIITHHPAWPYFAHRFGFQIRGVLVSQVGTEPSAKQIAALIRKVRKENIRVIVSEPQLNPKLPHIVAQETGARVVTLSPLPGAIPGTETYVDLMRYNMEQLVSALKE